MRVLITGAHGQVGRELQRQVPEGFEIIPYGSAELDISELNAVRQRFEHDQPKLVINAAAYTAVDKAESDASRAYAVNRDGPANLGVVAATFGIPVLHISTDYVFPGSATRPYRETDQTGPTGVYGASKLAGEQALAEKNPQHLILRTSWVFASHGNNFVKTMLRLAQNRDELGVVSDQIGCPTSASAIAAALWQLAEIYRQERSLQWGLYHYAGFPQTSWHEFARQIFEQALNLELLAKSPQVNPIPTSAYPTPASRPSWSVLDSSRLEASHGIAPRNWQQDLFQVLTELKQGLE